MRKPIILTEQAAPSFGRFNQDVSIESTQFFGGNNTIKSSFDTGGGKAKDYMLIADKEGEEAILVLKEDNTEKNKIPIIGEGVVIVDIEDEKIKIKGSYQGSSDGGVIVKVENEFISATIEDGSIEEKQLKDCSVTTNKLDKQIQTVLEYIDTEENISQYVTKSIDELSKSGAINDIIKDNGIIDNKISKALDSFEQTDYTVSCYDEEFDATDNAPAFKRHTLTQNGKSVCVIDVPRDLVIKSGSVDKKKNELVLVLVNDEEIRVDVSHLIEYVTGGTATDGIITVTVSDDFVATATINDGTITETKLHANVTAKLNKAWATTEQGELADSALQSVIIAGKTLTKTGGTTVSADEIATALDLANKYQAKGDYASAVQGTKADTALQKITTTEGNGLKVTNNNNIDIDTDVVFVLDCNW